jgi:Putative peptidoglycan binding domain
MNKSRGNVSLFTARQADALKQANPVRSERASGGENMAGVLGSATRPRGSHVAGLFLTATERVRLQIMQVQRRLSSLSLYEGQIDGRMNLETVAGVRQFQTLKGLRDTGTLTAGTLSALGVPPLD